MPLRSGNFLENCEYCGAKVHSGRHGVAECDKCGLRWGYRTVRGILRPEERKVFRPIGHPLENTPVRNFVLEEFDLTADREIVFYVLAAMYKAMNKEAAKRINA